LVELQSRDYKLPPKTRDIYLYLNFRMLSIFPTVVAFGNLDLKTGKKLGRRTFIITAPKKIRGGQLFLQDGSVVDLQSGSIIEEDSQIPIRRFVGVSLKKDSTIKSISQNYHRNGYFTVVYLQSYGRVVIMNERMFNSAYVQMFLLGKYDKELFELVVKSPYSRIYRLKK
jgi:dolichyl-diphosphooligosaccharide--protein glycosyltransferase/undecaprenyl-diphosphooligosaccharide--protein glycosyltransferase